MVIYLVTSGEYSDYNIDYIASTEAKAKEWIDAHGIDYNIEERDVDKEFNRGEMFQVRITTTTYGNGRPAKEDVSCCAHRCEEKKDTVYLTNTKYSSYSYETYSFVIQTDSAKRAVKIARERLAIIKAQPYLFPDLGKKFNSKRMERGLLVGFVWTPVYDYHTKEIINKPEEL